MTGSEDLSRAPYRDPQLDADKRARDLLERMSLAEKLAQLGCVWSTQLLDDEGFSEERAARLLADGTGQVTRIGAATGLRPRESAAFANRIQRFLLERTRLGIPALVHEESTAGYCARDADQFPQAIGLASTWNPELVEEMADVIRCQLRAVGARQTLAPVLDVARDPRWGRVEETYGEDPYLASRLGVAYVRGLQTDELRRGVVATGKHFLGYGLSEGGHNHKPVHLGARELREVFARPFLAAIQEAGLASMMNAYNEVDGLPCGGSKAILEDLLRGELGFEGTVVADYFTTLLLIRSHRVAADKGEAAERALRAGLDVELPARDCYGDPLRERVEDGRVPVELVDRSVLRVLRQKIELGLFEEPTVDEEAAASVYQTPAARDLARRLGAQSIVLLKNKGALLPLSASPGKVAVLGPCADDVRLLQGDYHYPAHVEMAMQRSQGDLAAILPRPDAASSFAPGRYFPPTVTPLDGIRAAVSDATEVLHEKGCDVSGDEAKGIDAAVELARHSDVALVFVGGKSGLTPDCTVGEFRDASALGLTGLQPGLVESVIATGTPTVVVLISGRVHAVPWIAEHAAALVQAWVPGEEGGAALADVLFGATNPSGRLPVSMPRSSGQLPLHSRRHWTHELMGPFTSDYADETSEALFPFGHGLSYTRFEYGELRAQRGSMRAGEPVELGFDLTNSGDRPGEEVVQLYVQDLVASVVRPVLPLVGFARVRLEPGVTGRVVFTLDPSQLAFYDAEMRFVFEPGEFLASVGASSADLRSALRFSVEGEVLELDPKRIAPTTVKIR